MQCEVDVAEYFINNKDQIVKEALDLIVDPMSLKYAAIDIYKADWLFILRSFAISTFPDIRYDVIYDIITEDFIKKVFGDSFFEEILYGKQEN